MFNSDLRNQIDEQQNKLKAQKQTLSNQNRVSKSISSRRSRADRELERVISRHTSSERCIGIDVQEESPVIMNIGKPSDTVGSETLSMKITPDRE